MSVSVNVTGNKLVIEVDLDVSPELSKSGKSRIIGTTNGFVRQSTPLGAIGISLNVNTTDEQFGKNGRRAAVPTPALVKSGAPV